MNFIDTRKFKRYRKETAFKLTLKTGMYTCKTIDYSAEGICLHIYDDTVPIVPGDTVTFTIQDPELDFQGEAAWIRDADTGYTVGLKRTGHLKGNCGDFHLSDIMIGLQRTMKTGVLAIMRGRKITTIYIRNGDFIFARSNQEGDRLGQLLIREGHITVEQCLKAGEELKKTGKRMGKILVEQGYIKPKELYQAIRKQVEGIILGIFQTECGSFEFREGPLPTTETITLRNSAANLIYKGVKRVVNFEYIWEDLPPLDAVVCCSQNPADLFQEIALDEKDREILSMIDGKKTIEKILSESPLRDFETVKTLYALLCARIITIKRDDTHPELLPAIIVREPLFKDRNYIKKINEMAAHYKTMKLYDILGVQAEATDKEIRRAYLDKSREFHPDRHFSFWKSKDLKEKLDEIFTQISLAYRTLSNGEKRRQYDNILSQQPGKKDTSNSRVAEGYFDEGKSFMDEVNMREEMFDGEISKKMVNNVMKAERLFCEAIYFDNSRSEYHFYHGIVLSRLKKLKEAVTAFNKAIKLEPSNSCYYAELGHVYLNLGFKQRAKSVFLKALKINPSDKRAREGKRIVEEG